MVQSNHISEAARNSDGALYFMPEIHRGLRNTLSLFMACRITGSKPEVSAFLARYLADLAAWNTICRKNDRCFEVGQGQLLAMKRLSVTLTVMGVGALAIGGWLALAAGSSANQTNLPEIADTEGAGPLDGMTFTGLMGPDGKPKDVADTFVFANGTFVSQECELRCKYPARPYFVRQIGSTTEFVSETRCPYKDATIVWRGTVNDGQISGVATWTMKRWYWTVKQDFEFAGSLVRQSAPVASTQ